MLEIILYLVLRIRVLEIILKLCSIYFVEFRCDRNYSLLFIYFTVLLIEIISKLFSIYFVDLCVEMVQKLF